MSMKDCYIVYAQRSPIGKFAGALSSVRVDDLLAHLMKDLLQKIPFSPTELDDVVVGCANQSGEDNRNLARMALILAGFPFEVPGTTINRLCGSSLDALMDGVGRISAGFAEAVVVGGAEGMTRAPYVISKAQSGFARDQVMYDTSLGWRFTNPKMEAMFPLYTMGETAEEVAKLHKISREDQDKFALRSHQRAIEAQSLGKFKEELISIPVPSKKETIQFTQDEGPRKDSSLEALAKLKPAFRKDGTVTAGNSSSLNDGAALLLLVSGEFLKRHKLTPLVRITGAAVRGCHPNTMGLGPVHSTKLLCEKYHKKSTQFDVVELNEAFAAQALACIRELGLDESKVNRNGGAIALGHPLGCSGARIMTTLIHQMRKDQSLKEGLATMCIGLGQGISVSVERA